VNAENVLATTCEGEGTSRLGEGLSARAVLISDPHQRSSSAIIVEGWVRAREAATRKHAQAGNWLLGAGTLTTPSCKRVARFVADGLLYKPFATITQKRMCGGT
jgi:hypothetical protein